MIPTHKHLTDVLDAVVKGELPADELKKATMDFLCAYADTRAEVIYDSKNLKSPVITRANRLCATYVKGQFPYPFTDDGVPMVAGMIICRPDGSKAVLTRVELESTRRKVAPITLFFDDGLVYNGPIKGFNIPKIATDAD